MQISLLNQKTKYTVHVPVCQWKKARDSNPGTDARTLSSGTRLDPRCRPLNGDAEARVSDFHRFPCPLDNPHAGL